MVLYTLQDSDTQTDTHTWFPLWRHCTGHTLQPSSAVTVLTPLTSLNPASPPSDSASAPAPQRDTPAVHVSLSTPSAPVAHFFFGVFSLFFSALGPIIFYPGDVRAARARTHTHTHTHRQTYPHTHT